MCMVMLGLRLGAPHFGSGSGLVRSLQRPAGMTIEDVPFEGAVPIDAPPHVEQSLFYRRPPFVLGSRQPQAPEILELS
jgi:hypothetical protein